MTCVVGIEHEGRVILGADAAGTAGWSQTIRADPKVFSNGPFIMGFTSSFRMGQLLRYKLEAPVPTRTDLKDLDRFVATTFIDAVRKTFNDNGYGKIDNNREHGGCFLVGVAGRLFTIDNDYQTGRSIAGYDAVGCGDDIALGSLHTTAQYAISPRQRATLALEAAAALSAGVAAPFTFVEA